MRTSTPASAAAPAIERLVADLRADLDERLRRLESAVALALSRPIPPRTPMTSDPEDVLRDGAPGVNRSSAAATRGKRQERPPGALRVLWKSLDQGKRGTGLTEAEPTLQAEARDPAHGGPLEGRMALPRHEHTDGQGIVELDVGQLCRLGVDEREVAQLQRTAEAGVGTPLDRHEHMFPRDALAGAEPVLGASHDQM